MELHVVALALSTFTSSLGATSDPTARITNGSIATVVHEQGVIVGVPSGALVTYDALPVVLDGGVSEWVGVSYDGPDGHVEAAGGDAPDWAARRELEPVLFQTAPDGALAVTRVDDLLVETRFWFDDDGDFLIAGITLTNVGSGTLSMIHVTREWRGAGESWSFPYDYALPLDVAPDVCRRVWMLDNLEPGKSAGVGLSYAHAAAAESFAGGGVDVPLSLWTNATWPGGLVIGDTNGISFGDYDADGNTDIFACMEGTLFRNLDGADWQLVADLDSVLPPTNRRYGSSFGDYDNDGFPDIGTEPREGWGGDECLHLLRSLGGTGYEDIATNPLLMDVQACQSDAETICWGDVDGDGNLDFVLPVYPPWVTGPGNFFYYNNGPVGPGGAYTFSEQSGPAGLDNPPGSARPEGAQLLDTDFDGDMDFYCNGTLYINESVPGTADFDDLNETESGIAFSTDLEEGIVFLDMDMDGDLDMAGVWSNSNIGVRIHEARGDGSYRLLPQSVVASPAIGLDLGISAEDWDNDGDMDFTTRQVFRRNMWVETGTRSFTVATHGIPANHLTSATPAWGDWDKDGDLDCALGNWLNVGHFYQNDLYDAGTPDGERRYVRVRVMRDSESVSQGLETEYGASVEIDVAGDPLVRKKFVSSSGGYLNQNEYVLHFALPDDPAPANPAVDVTFDVVVDLSGPPVDGYLRIDRHVNPALGGIQLAELADREIVVFRSGLVVIDGCELDPAAPVSKALTTSTDGLVRPAPGASVSALSNTPGPDHYVGIEFDTLAATGPVRMTEILLDGRIPQSVPSCAGEPVDLALWDVTAAGSPVAVLELDTATTPRNNRSYLRVNQLLEPGRVYRLVAYVDRLRPTPVSAPVATGSVTVRGGLSFQDLDPCSGANVEAAAVDASQVYAAFRFNEDAGSPFVDLGNGLAGTSGVPALSGTGTLVPGDPYTVDLSGAEPNAPVLLIVGFSQDCLNIFGGTVVPALDLLVGSLATDGTGALSFGGSWPALSAGTSVWVQYGVVDLGAPQAIAFSNALAATTQP